MTTIPRDPLPESTMALVADGYAFTAKRRRMLDSDIFTTRLMLREATVIVGEDAAEFFYTGDRFTRNGAMPPTTLRLLQDKGSVQLLDGAAHRHRKQMFMSLMTPASLARIVAAFDDAWQARLPFWQAMDEVVLQDEAQSILTRAACAWAGIPISDPSAARRTREFATMVEGAGLHVPKQLLGLVLREINELWARRVIAAARAGSPKISEGSPAYVVAWHREPHGDLLSLNDAAVELINLLRPTVAVANYITFAALALYRHPECREMIAGGDDRAVERFAQEVRRTSPFFPAIGGRALRALEWNGLQFPEDSWILLDIHGTNQSPRIWGDPHVFRPDRFLYWNGSPFNFIPQGAGDPNTDHRCPGEETTIELIKAAARHLVAGMRYDVPEQDLSVDLSMMPALPASRFVMTNIRGNR